MNYCAVAICPSPKGITYFSFPPASDPRRSVWINACHRGDNPTFKTARICERHFSFESFKRDLKNELLNKPVRKILKKDAVPTLHLLPIKSFLLNTDERQERSAKRARKSLIQEILSEYQDIEDPAKQKLLETEQPVMEEPESSTLKEIISHKSVQVDTAWVAIDKMRELEKENKKLKNVNKSLRVKNKRLMSSNRNMWGRVCKVNSKAYQRGIAANLLKESFSDGQIKRLLYKKVRVKWSHSDVIFGLRLRSHSIRTFQFVRKFSPLPLPSLTTLKNYVKKFRCRPGIQKPVLSIMKQRLSDMKEEGKKLAHIAVLMFDEVELKKKFELDQCEDQIFGPDLQSKGFKAQVAMIRGIFNNWKQPIYFNFNQPMSTPLLK